ncbi:hypothetical protein AXG93_4295s1560 [Marchantia polymorpha subsp. ruderalis]|uniref:Uncharacterized protein n=1 Tax=Marchantia polymorpha subsp. ruderalis TaxID=1480154 RepID=A0A176WAN1_MARPO|nr:hypothetical protein AXG93_4295s1560 [Marchantia polymorpha subsp. ruderalis]
MLNGAYQHTELRLLLLLLLKKATHVLKGLAFSACSCGIWWVNNQSSSKLNTSEPHYCRDRPVETNRNSEPNSCTLSKRELENFEGKKISRLMATTTVQRSVHRGLPSRREEKRREEKAGFEEGAGSDATEVSTWRALVWFECNPAYESELCSRDAGAGTSTSTVQAYAMRASNTLQSIIVRSRSLKKSIYNESNDFGPFCNSVIP